MQYSSRNLLSADLHLSPLIDDARNRFNVDGKRHRDAEAIVATRWLIEVASKVSQGCQHATFFHKRDGGERGGVSRKRETVGMPFTLTND